MTGTVKVVGNIRVYEDPQATIELLTYDFPEFDNTESNIGQNKDIYIKNLGNVKNL